MRTWKKALSLLLTLSMLLSLCVVGASAEELADEPASEPTIQTVEPTDVDGVDAQDVTYVAAIDNTQYETLAAAVTAAMSGNTIRLLTDCEGSGIFLAAGDKTLTIDFGGHTYTVNSLVGSSGTENQAFHLEKGNHVTLKNGEIKVAESAANSVKMLIQNYCDLNADGITLDGSTYSSMEYVFSNNDGNITINNCTITAPENCVAVDAAIWGSYAGASVAIENSTIIGDLEVAQWSSVGGWHKVDGFSATPDGRPILKVNSGSFTDLADAVLCAQDNATINLAEDITLTDTLAVSDGQTLTLNLNGKTLSKDNKVISVSHGTLNVTGSGIIHETANDGYAPILITGSTDASDANYSVVNIGKDVTLGGWSGLFINQNSKHAYGVVVNFDGEIVSPSMPSHAAPGNAIYVNGQIQDNSANCPHITIGPDASVTASKGGTAIYAAGYAVWDIQGGTFTGAECVEIKAGTMNISSGDFTATAEPSHTANSNGTSTAGYALAVVENAAYGDPVTVEVTDGKFNGPVAILDDDDTADNNDGTLTISGGYFTADPTAYLADGKAALESDNAGYVYMVGEKRTEAAEVVVAAPTVEAPTGLNEDEQALADSLKAALTATAPGSAAPAISTDVVAAAAKTVANNNTVTTDTTVASGRTVLDELKTVTSNSNLGADAVTIVVQPYMAINIEDVKIDAESKTLKLDITPMYKTVATTANVATGADIVLEADASNPQKTVNAVEVGKEATLTITKPVTVTVPLPAGFTSESTLFVKHITGSGRTYFYTGSVANNVLNFINPHGFSEFELSTKNDAAAEIDGIGYATLQDAVDAVADNGTITVLKNDQTATVGKTIAFTVAGSATGTKITAGSNTTLTMSNNDKTYSFKYTAPQGGNGGGGSGATTYTISISNLTNGTVKSSVSSAAKGDTVTLTVTPAIGYTLDTLTVKDASGSTITMTKKSATSYTFTMPSSKVTVTAAFAKDETVLPFTDVASGAYYYDAVQWAVDEGVTSGTSATTFAPNVTCTRAQTVTFLWRAMGSPEPTTTSNPFTDVSADAYYYKAVLWAVEKGITAGTSATTFAPDATVSRAQTVTFLWRAAGQPTAATTGSFTDVNSSDYFAGAVAWAVEKGITSGTSATTFNPVAGCTRGQIVTFLYRYLGK